MDGESIGQAAMLGAMVEMGVVRQLSHHELGDIGARHLRQRADADVLARAVASRRGRVGEAHGPDDHPVEPRPTDGRLGPITVEVGVLQHPGQDVPHQAEVRPALADAHDRQEDEPAGARPLEGRDDVGDALRHDRLAVGLATDADDDDARRPVRPPRRRRTGDRARRRRRPPVARARPRGGPDRRTNARTAWPASRRRRTASSPTPPLAPKTMTFIARPTARSAPPVRRRRPRSARPRPGAAERHRRRAGERRPPRCRRAPPRRTRA